MVAGCRQLLGFEDAEPVGVEPDPDAPMAVICEELPDVADGSVNIDGTMPGAIATYVCDDGFHLVGGAMLVCTSSGAWSDAPPECKADCPCFDNLKLDLIEADANGEVFCEIDSSGGGTTGTFFIAEHTSYRFVANALEADGQLLCEFGCLDDTNDAIDDCAEKPTFQQLGEISIDQHADCRTLIVPRCAQ